MYVEPHPKGFRFHVQINGKRRSKVWASKREGQAWAKKLELEFAQPSAPEAETRTLKDATDHYLLTVSPEKRGIAQEWERRRFDAMLAHFGGVTAITDITSDTIGRWRDARLATVSGSTVQREANLLRHLFTLAVDEWRWIERNPFKGVRLPKENAARNALWGWGNIKRVLRAGQRATGKTKEMAEAFHIALRTGMRLQEVLAAPAHFDARRRVVTVPTKTTDRPEEIPVGRIACKLLTRAPFVVGPNEGSTLFSKLCRSLMIEGLTFHDARATALTHLAKKVDVMVLARISRHKDISLLHRVYYRTTAEEIARKL